MISSGNGLTGFMFNSKFIAVFLALFMALVWMFLSLFLITSHYGYGGADNISHYHISRYAFTYPCMFFDLWGKPVFTLLSSFFALGGIKGIYVFNSLVSAAAAWFAYRLAKEMKIRMPLLALIFTSTAPVFFYTAPTALTEPLFAFWIIVSSFLFLSKRYFASAVFLSFIIFVRNEGFLFFPLFAIALIINRKWKIIPFLATGFVLVSIAGLFCYDDVLWIIRMAPYSGGTPYYGSGHLLHFINNTAQTWGYPLAFASLAGIFASIGRVFTTKEDSAKELSFILIIAGGAVLYIAAHSLVWWKGIGSSAGLLRVMTSIIPLLAVMGAYGVEIISVRVRRKFYTNLIVLILIVPSVFIIIGRKTLYYQLQADEKTIASAVRFLQNNAYDSRRVLYFNPLVPLLLNIDPFDESKSLSAFHNHRHTMLEPGDIILWDAHFGPNECKTPKETLLDDSSLKLLAVFRPESDLYVLGDRLYEVLLFEKLNPAETANNYELLNKYPYELMKATTVAPIYEMLCPTDSFADCIVDSAKEFAITYQAKYPFSTMKYEKGKNGIMFIADYCIIDRDDEIKMAVIVSFENSKGSYKYLVNRIDAVSLCTNGKELSWSVIELPKPETDDDVFKFYIWNIGREGKLRVNYLNISLVNLY